MNQLVSVITPTYNRAHLLPRVWASLLKQTEQRFQWIIIDDGSTDSSREVIQGFNDPRVIYIWQENQGVNSARNRGEEEVQADFVIFLDSDDELLNETTLDEMLTEIQVTRPEIACVSFTVKDSKGDGAFFYIPEERERFEANYLDHVCEQISGEFFPIYRRDALSISRWPPLNGMEVLRVWRIALKRPVLIVNRPARIYHSKGCDSLTNIDSVINRAGDMVLGIKSSIL